MGTDPRPRRVRTSGADTYRGRVSEPSCLGAPRAVGHRVATPAASRCEEVHRTGAAARRRRRPAADVDRLGAAGATSASGWSCVALPPPGRPRRHAARLGRPRRRGDRGRRVRLRARHRRRAGARPIESLRARGRPGHPGDVDGVRRRAGAACTRWRRCRCNEAGPALPAGAGRADPADRRPRRRPWSGSSPGPAPTSGVHAARLGAARRPAPAGAAGAVHGLASSAWAPSSGCTIPSPALTSATDERRRVLLTSLLATADRAVATAATVGALSLAGMRPPGAEDA